MMSEKVGRTEEVKRTAEAVLLSGLGIGLTSKSWIGAETVNPL